MINKLLTLALTLSPFLLSAQTPCSGGMAGSYPCNGITLQSYISAATMGAAEGQDSWGWTDPMDGKEYAIVALDNGTAFVDITDPVNPIYLGRLDSHTGSSLWRDVKVYNNHAYIVSDSNGNHGMQIFDLTKLRSVVSPPVTFTRDGRETWGSTGSNRGRAHNIVINEDTGHAYVTGVSPYISGGVVVFDLSVDPVNPTIEATYSSSGYCHDAQVITYNGPDPDYQGKEIMIGSFSSSDFVRVLQVNTNLTNGDVTFTPISNIDYSNKNYTHQGWFTEDQRFFIVGDELDEDAVGFNTRTLVFDMQDLDNPVLHYTHYGETPAIDHNGYVRGNRFYLANYAAGMRILKFDDLYDPNVTTDQMTEVNYFDTFPSSNAAGFNATWNVYPYFESGNLIATGFGNEFINGDGGLFVLKDPLYDNVDPTVVCQNITATLDKTTGSVTISALDVDGGSTDNFGITKRTITGQTTFTCADAGNNFNVTLTVEDDYGNKSSCVATVTVAGETTEYLGGGTWSAGTPDIGSNAKISTDYNTSTGGNSSFDACTCEVDAGRTLTVAAGDYINITKDIDVNGTLVVEHEGSVVQTLNSGTTTNNGTINVLQSTPTLASRDFMILGSPMTGETRGSVWNSAFLVLDANTSNFVPNPDVEAQFPGAENFADDNNNFFLPYGAGGSVTAGEGYLVRPQAGYGQPGGVFNYTYDDGTLNTGDVTFNVTYNTPGPTSADNKNASPNVLANPYPSAIFADDFINANAMVDEVFFWEHLTPPSPGLPGAGAMNFSMEDISMYNLSGGVGAGNPEVIATRPNGYIATGQGFGIKATAGGTATFTNAMRRTTGNNTLRNQNNKDRVWIEVVNAEYEMGGSTLVAFNENATAGLDNGYDSRRLATVVSLYSHLVDGSEQLGIQTREAFGTGIKVPVGFSTLLDDTLDYKISISTIEGENLEGATVYLFDNYMNTVTNLSEGAYAFSSEKGTFHNRFTLQFEGESVLGPDENGLENITLFPNPTNGTVNIHSPHAYIKDIEVFDIRGRRFFEHIYEEKNAHTAHLELLETGIYFVTITTNLGQITKKMIKK